MDGKQDRIEIPKVVYQGDDEKLKERVYKFKEGSFRIAVFTMVGLIMGYFSHTYVTDTFFPTKLLIAIPYKVCETIYVFLLGTDAAELADMGIYCGWMTEFFPHSMIATLLAETVTTMLIGGAIYGSLAYFTGDKRVFTLQRFVKFFSCWCVIILLTIGAAYGVNAKAKMDNENFQGDAAFFFYDQRGNGSLARGEELREMLQEYFHKELEQVTFVRDRENEVPLAIYYDHDTRFGLYQINYAEKYVVTEKGQTYRISREFAQIAQDYAEGRGLPGMKATEIQEVAE